jgi:hypothetical protein
LAVSQKGMCVFDVLIDETAYQVLPAKFYENDFLQIMLDGISEKNYFEIRGGKLVEEWENAKNATFRTAFLTHLNKNINARRMRLLCGDYPDASYQATVYVLKNTVGRKKGVTCEMVFMQKGNDVPLGKITFSGKSRKLFGVQGGSIIYVTGTAFGYAGEKLGKTMARKIK